MSELPLKSGENITNDGNANRISFWGGPGGKMVLTNQRLLFTNRRKSKILNEYPLTEIVAAVPALNITIWSILILPLGLLLLLLRNCLQISLKNGQTQRFVVTKRSEWIEKLNQPRNA